MRIYLDTEFMEDGYTIDLLSLGAVREDGAEFYAVNLGADRSKANDWVKEHVLPHLDASRPGPYDVRVNGNREEIARYFRQFANGQLHGSPVPMWIPEFWGYFADYDWVAVCQLYGRMIDLPSEWPQFCLDVKQEMHRLRVTRGELPAVPTSLPDHHALGDARWTRAIHQYLLRRA